MSNTQAPQLDIATERRSFGRRQGDTRNEQLARVIAEIPDGILCCNHDWYITFANAEAVRLLHLTPEEMASKTHWEIFPEKIGSDVERIYRDAMRTGESSHFEYFCAPRDVWLDTHVIPTQEGVTIYFRNVTDHK